MVNIVPTYTKSKMDVSQRSFYMMLPSNVKYDVSRNTASHFITPLARALELPSKDWEVTLVEVNYTYSFYNILPPINKIHFGKHNSDITIQVVTRYVDVGFYRSLSKPIDAIKSKKPGFICGYFKKEIITYTVNTLNETNDGTTVSLGKDEFVTLHPALARILGFPINHLTNHRKVPKDRLRIKSSLLPSLGTELFNLYIYSNIVKETLVGDTLVPFLRTIPVIGENGDYISKTFETPHYLPLARDFFQHIEIKITDDIGENVQLKFGKTIIKLHFRRKPKFNYI